MQAKKIFAIAAAAISSAVCAVEPSITDVTARQLWPWSTDVDIAFTLSGTNSSVKFTAQYDGVEPFVLREHDLSGDFFEIEPGRHHVRWSPSRAGLSGDSLTNFRIVSAEPDTTDHTYLILNLTDGSFSFAAEEPAGGWTSDPAYYQTNIVFRRIKAGSATLGIPKAFFDNFFPDLNWGDIYGYSRPHNVTLTSDFYIGVFSVTKAQRYLAEQHLLGNTPDVSTYEAVIPDSGTSYNDLRGSTADGIDWPNTKYEVKEGSVISAFRSICANTFPKGWIIDLPTTMQWEYAARADTPTNQLWSVGGLATDSGETITNCLDQIAIWAHNKDDYPQDLVGRKLPNKWGLYDMIGLCAQWNLDWYSNDPKYYRGTNPVGPASDRSSRRCRRGISRKNAFVQTAIPAVFGTNSATVENHYRLCIHLKSLFD